MRMRACENIFLGIPCFKSVNLKKKILQYCIAVREQQRIRPSYHRVFCRENQELTELFCSGLLVGDSITSCTPGFWYMQISRRRGRTASNFAIYDFSSRIILKSGLLSQIAAEHVLKVQVK